LLDNSIDIWLANHYHQAKEIIPYFTPSNFSLSPGKIVFIIHFCPDIRGFDMKIPFLGL
jgi:hypothetical protein